MPDQPDIFEDLAVKLTKDAMENIDSELERNVRLPLLLDARAIITIIMANVVRHAMHNLAEFAMDGVDIRAAFIPERKEKKRRKPPEQPPSPL